MTFASRRAPPSVPGRGYDARVKIRAICLAALILVACKEEPAPSPKKEEPVATTPPPAPAPAPAPPADAAPAAAPALPSDPKELAELRKKAILDAKYDVAVTICAAEDTTKMDEQSLLSCVLSACRQNQVEKAQAWGKLLKGPLKTQAKKICLASRVPI
jgi:hypothetical protein